jgi:hypothetical protein
VICCSDFLSQLQGLDRTELICSYILLDCRMSETNNRVDMVVLVTERESGGHADGWLVKEQGLRVSDIVWGAGVNCVTAGQ